jgi:hypothetical protein
VPGANHHAYDPSAGWAWHPISLKAQTNNANLIPFIIIIIIFIKMPQRITTY